MTSFLAIYRGSNINRAQLVAVSADPALVAEISLRLIETKTGSEDSVINEIENGKRSALKLIAEEGKNNFGLQK